MTHEKAREFFSAYFEDSLEPGLRQAIEQRFRADSDLRRDYQDFAETMRSLDTMKFEEIEIPIFLSDRIATRIEEAQSKHSPAPFVWANWLRTVTLAGLGAAALVGAVVGLRSFGYTGSTGNLFSNPGQDGPKFSAKGSEVSITYRSANHKPLVVSSGSETWTLDGSSSTPRQLDNPNRQAVLYTARIQDDPRTIELAVPGKDRINAKVGEGTIEDFAKALADFYRIPVELTVSNSDKHVAWSFDSMDARTAAGKALEGEGYSVDQRSNDLISVLDR